MRECRKCAFRQASRKNGHLYICTRSTPPTVLHDEAGCDEYTENVKDLLWAAKHTDERIRAYASDVERYADMPGAYELRRELTDQINNLADQLVELRRTARFCSSPERAEQIMAEMRGDSFIGSMAETGYRAAAAHSDVRQSALQKFVFHRNIALFRDRRFRELIREDRLMSRLTGR